MFRPARRGTLPWVGLYARHNYANFQFMAEPIRKPGYSALRKGRVDLVEARYFLTLTLRRSLPEKSLGLHDRELESIIISTAQAIRVWDLHSIVVMPDHLHLLITLTEPKLSAAVRELKGTLTPSLREHSLRWQPGFYDHRLRPDDKVGGILRYMWLNPYRAGLGSTDQSWTGWWCSAELEKWIGGAAGNTPAPGWWK